MCGIIGKVYFSLGQYVERQELKIMTDALRHRGPDDEGYYVDNNVGLGFRRLSIIDLRDGHQPMSDNAGKYWITFNGEIYNYKELRKDLRRKGYTFRTNSDTEVIVNLYAEHKEKCLGYLRGMFAFVIWDSDKKQLFGARDRFGIKPFHYYIDNEKLLWASEIKSILASKNIGKDLSIESLDYYFAYGYSQRDQTVYKNIKKLKPGHYFNFKVDANREIIEKPYWELEFSPDYSKSESYWKSALYDSLNESVKMRMISDVPLGAFLSGGVDSSIIVALMALNSNKPIKTFSIGFKEREYNELKYARQVAEKYSTDHHELIVEPKSIDLLPDLVRAYDEPFSDSSSIPTYYLSKFTREHVTVALSGDGGDELFAGYKSYHKMMTLKNSPFNNALTNKTLYSFINRIMPDYFYGKGLSYYLSKNKQNLFAYYCLWKNYERSKLFNTEVSNRLEKYSSENIKINILNAARGDYLSKMQQLDINTYMVDDILTKVDRSSMVNSLEARVPILDHKFAELSFSIPSEFKLTSKKKKYILSESFKHILPDGLTSRKKMGFGVPLKIWFNNDLKDYVYDTLIEGSELENYLDAKYIRQTIEYHEKGVRDYSQKIWSILFLNEWLKQNK
jgi:asparagine synthase (glutamine-hydrolysing)